MKFQEYLSSPLGVRKQKVLFNNILLWISISDSIMPKKFKKFYLGVIFRKKLSKKSIFDHLQLTADNKNRHSSRTMCYSANESWWNLLQKSEKIWGGVGVGKGSNFALKFRYRKKWVFCDFFIFTRLKSFFSAQNHNNIIFIGNRWF